VGWFFGPTLYWFASNQGQVVIGSDDDLELVLRQGEEVVLNLSTNSGRTAVLPAGSYQVELSPRDDDRELTVDRFTRRRGSRVVLSARQGPPVIREIHRFQGHRDFPTDAAFCLDDRCVLSCGGSYWQANQWFAGSDFALRLWDVQSGKEIRRL